MSGWDDDPTNPWSAGQADSDQDTQYSDEAETDGFGADLDDVAAAPVDEVEVGAESYVDVVDQELIAPDETEAAELPAETVQAMAPVAASVASEVPLDPAIAVEQVEAATFGPLTAPPSDEERDLLPGVTDVAADIGFARGVGTDELGLVEVAVNGLMGVAVALEPGLVPLGTEQVGHHLAEALEEARDEVVGYLEAHFRSHSTTAEWLESRPESDETGLSGGKIAAHPQGRSCTSKDELVTVLMSPNGEVASVVINSDEVDLPQIAAAFVEAAELALQGGDAGDHGMDMSGRMAAFDAVLAKLDKSMDDLSARLDRALGS